MYGFSKPILFRYSMEFVQEDLKNVVPFSVATDAPNKGNRNFSNSHSIYPPPPPNGICLKILDIYGETHLKIIY